MARREQQTPKDILTSPVFLSVILTFFVLVSLYVFNPTSLHVLARREATPPQVSFVNLTDGGSIGDGTTRLIHYYLTAKFEEENPTNRAYLSIDGVEYIMANYDRNTQTWSHAIYMPDFDNGPHVLRAYATDKWGNLGEKVINVTFNNGPQSDFTGPELSVTNPQEGFVFERRTQYPITYQVSDNSQYGVNRVEVYLSAKDKQSGNWTWNKKCFDYTGGSGDTCYLSEIKGYSGELLLEVIAYDWEGNSTKVTKHGSIK